MLVAAALAAACSLVVALIGSFSMPLLMLFVGLYMGVSAALYPIAVAITNDLMDSHRITAASTALLLSYGLGSCLGPPLSSLFMELLGPRGLFVSNALVLGGYSLLMSTRFGQAQTPVEEQEHFYTTTPEATLGLQELDPRNPDFETGSGHDIS